MKVVSLLKRWQAEQLNNKAVNQLTVNLSDYDLARLNALYDLFPEQKTEQMLTDLVVVILNEIQEKLPYVKGDKVIANDEFGEPIYEDIGLTPEFIKLTKHHCQRIVQ